MFSHHFQQMSHTLVIAHKCLGTLCVFQNHSVSESVTKSPIGLSSLRTEDSSVAGAKIEFYINEGFNLGLKKPMDWSTCPLCLKPTRNDKISKHLAEQHGYKTRKEGDQENLEKAKLEAIKIGPFPH